MKFTANVERKLMAYFEYRQSQVVRKKKEIYMKVDFGCTRAEEIDFRTGEVKAVDSRVINKEFYKFPSYNYDINIAVNKGARILVCEFSIPKYLYGHNLNLFPEQPDKDFKKLYVFCVQAVKRIFNENLHDVDFQIERLDICYNYKFANWARKSDYIDVIERYVTRHNRKFMNFKNETFMRITEGYSVKIYDKEKEFAKNDLNELRKYYANEGIQRDVAEKMLQGLVDFSKNILRIELTARKLEINRAFWRSVEKQHFFDKFEYLRLIEMYKKVQLHINQLQILNKIDTEFTPRQLQKQSGISNCKLWWQNGVYSFVHPKHLTYDTHNYFLYIRDFDLSKHKLINVQHEVESAIHPKFKADYKKIKQILSIKNCIFQSQFMSYYTRDILLNSPLMSELWSKLTNTVWQINRYCKNAKPVSMFDYLKVNAHIIERDLGISKRGISSLRDYLSILQIDGDKVCKERCRKRYYRNMKVYDRICEAYDITEHTKYISEFIDFQSFKNYDKKILV